MNTNSFDMYCMNQYLHEYLQIFFLSRNKEFCEINVLCHSGTLPAILESTQCFSGKIQSTELFDLQKVRNACSKIWLTVIKIIFATCTVKHAYNKVPGMGNFPLL